MTNIIKFVEAYPDNFVKVGLKFENSDGFYDVTMHVDDIPIAYLAPSDGSLMLVTFEVYDYDDDEMLNLLIEYRDCHAALHPDASSNVISDYEKKAVAYLMAKGFSLDRHTRQNGSVVFSIKIGEQ